jgi:hypothetical protein
MFSGCTFGKGMYTQVQTNSANSAGLCTANAHMYVRRQYLKRTYLLWRIAKCVDHRLCCNTGWCLCSLKSSHTILPLCSWLWKSDKHVDLCRKHEVIERFSHTCYEDTTTCHSQPRHAMFTIRNWMYIIFVFDRSMLRVYVRTWAHMYAHLYVCMYIGWWEWSFAARKHRRA